MTAVLDASHEIIDCPHCKGKVKVEVEREPANVKINKGLSAEDLEPIIERAIEKKMPKPKEEPAKKKEEITLQSHVPGYKCKNCGDAHPNKGYRKKVKHRCTGDRGDGEECGQYSPDGKGKCPWCGKVDEYEELDDDALENMPQPKEMEHDHEHE